MVTKRQIKRQNSALFHLEAVERFGNIPIIETGFKTAENVYERIKGSNRLFNWYFGMAETTISATIESLLPAVQLFEGPIKRIDEIMCKSLDKVEQRAPLVYLPPEMMIFNTKEYMSDRLVKPVLKRADSVKQLRNAVLDSPLTIGAINAAADKIDDAITVADKYVDKYLAVEGETQSERPEIEQNNEEGPMKAIHHGQRFSRKLKRRLTQRTIAEAKALKEHSKEAIHILIYAAELILTDPKQALEKAQELWSYLSKDEPENQARPKTLEELLVLLTRESARRVVHLVNFTANAAYRIPKSIINSTTELANQFIIVIEHLGSTKPLTELKNKTAVRAEGVVSKVTETYDEMQAYANNALEHLAIFLSGRIEAEKITTTNPRRRIHTRTNNPMQNNLNGVY
ncbi:lipid storage droplets surface-binding protein 1 [Condylostylus longicornis]|uniref:lipid storage droplets surface-binding protein 1 n=1 Tax=Condylostylus longicornis TaxID=2530218 RepID=UPI00244DAA83|nr:lipid storage droplets surface-binding protein 1 [Condylostylus longicornis]